MKHLLTAKFDTYDAAETAARAVSHEVPDTEILYVRPRHPESMRLSRPKARRFTLVPTAVTTMNYYTLLIEREPSFGNLSEVQKRQTADIGISCTAECLKKAESIIIGKGGSIIG